MDHIEVSSCPNWQILVKSYICKQETTHMEHLTVASWRNWQIFTYSNICKSGEELTHIEHLPTLIGKYLPSLIFASQERSLTIWIFLR
jgi:hypothetical protein